MDFAALRALLLSRGLSNNGGACPSPLFGKNPIKFATWNARALLCEHEGTQHKKKQVIRRLLDQFDVLAQINTLRSTR